MIVVKNTNKAEFKKSWDSKPYVFPPGEEVEISEQAAKFLFAFGMDDHERERAMIRNGWLKTHAPDAPFGVKAAQDILAGFVFKKAAEKQVEKPAKKLEAVADDLPARQRLHLPGSSKAIGPSRLPPA